MECKFAEVRVLKTARANVRGSSHHFTTMGNACTREEQWVHKGPYIPLREPDQPFGQYLLQRLRSLGDQVVLINAETDESLTAAQLLVRSVGVALQLRARGVRPGNVVTGFLDNSFESSYSLFGAFFAGAVYAPVNPDLDPDDTCNLMGLLEPRVVISAPRSVDKIKAAVPASTPIIAVQNDNPEWDAFVNPSASAVASFQEYSKAKPDDVLCILCSSGTTGPPKGVMLSHRIWHYYTQILMSRFTTTQTPEILGKLVSLQVTPNFWVSGFMMNIMNVIMGRPNVIYKKFEVTKVLEGIQKYRVTVLILSPPLVAAIAKFPDVEKYDVSSITDFFYGGAALSPDLRVLAEKRLQKSLIECYGQTECLQGIFPVPGTPRGSIGKVSANTKAKIVDTETGKSLGPNTEGEIWIKSKLSFSGYYKNPKATADTLDKDGWIHSGDAGYVDENGFFYILDRYKELIKYRGVQMAPAEVEGMLTAHEGVKDAAVVGIEHDEDQEHPVAFVVRQDGHSLSAEDLRRTINEPLPEYKKLRALHLIDAIPRTETGKIQRRLLRQRARELKV